jgi:hypothetical protein
LRGLLALKAVREHRWKDAERKRQQSIVSRREEKHGALPRVPDGAGAGGGSRPWRLSVDGPRAAIDTAIAGVGYLLSVSLPSQFCFRSRTPCADSTVACWRS